MLICLLLTVSATQTVQVGLVTSSLTDERVLSYLSSNIQGAISEVEQSLNYQVSFELLHEDIDRILQIDESKWSIPSIFLNNHIQVILDAGSSVRFSNFLADRCAKYSLLQIVISRPINTLSDETSYSSTLYAETSFIEEGKVITDLISYFGWQNLGIIHDKTIETIQASNTIKSESSASATILDEVIFDSSESIETSSIIYRLKSITKDSGARVISVLTKNNLASQILYAADNSIMGGVGFAWILNGEAMDGIGLTLKNSYAGLSQDLSLTISGALGVRPADYKNFEKEPLTTYIGVLSLIGKAYTKLKKPSGQEIRSYILTNPSIPSLQYPLKFDKNGVKTVNYKIFNINNFDDIEVGEWNSLTRSISFSEYRKIIWPGFTSTIPNDKIPIIQLGLLYPGHDNNGNTLKLGREILRGFNLAIHNINNDESILNGYQIQGIATDTFLLPSLAYTNLNSLTKDSIVGFVGPHSLDLCQAYVTAQDHVAGNKKPLLTNLASSTTLSDSNNYPNVLQIIEPDGLQAVALTLFIQLEGWQKVGVIYTDDDYGLSLYSSFLANIGTLDVVIENNEADRIIKYSLNSDGKLTQSTKDSVDDALSKIVRKQIKVIVYLGNPYLAPEVARVGYKKELQGDEYAWVGGFWLTEYTLSLLDTDYKDDKSDILKVFNGAIGLDYRNAYGDVGEIFASSYLSTYGEKYSKESLLTYDAVLTYATVLNGMISRGDDYNNGDDVVNSLRSADLTGASGKIKFSEGSNGRSAYGYNIINYQNNTITEVLEYDPLNPNLFTVLNNNSIIWGDKSENTPSDSWSSSYDCPFAKHMSRSSPAGLGIIIAIGSFLFILTLILSYFSYKKWKQIEISPITSPVIRSWKDTLVQAQIAIEFFQFIAIAPTFSSLEIVIKAASNIFMLDIMKVASSNKSDYWILLVTVCVLCYVWFFLVMIIMLNGDYWMRKVPFCKRTISIMNSLFLPFFGNTFFLPALALLLDMFVCDHRAQGHDYVWRDCYTNCWEGKHNTYIGMSVIAILCYEPIAAYSRPLWQQSRTGLNLKIQPFFLLLKTCVQILLIAIGKSLQSTSPLAHGIVFTILISLFTLSIYKLQPFNYHRCNLWEFSSILAVSYLSFLATLSNAKDPKNVGWFIALAIGWAIIFLVSILIQRRYMPNLLLPPTGSRTTKKIYDIISIKSNFPDNMDESNVSKVVDNSKVDESSIQVENRVEDESRINEESRDYIEVQPMVKIDSSKESY